MAKRLNEGEDLNPTDAQIADTENKGRAAEEVVIVNEPKKVKIHVSEDVECIIAGTKYELTKGKDYAVPSDVAAILCFGEKAYRI